MQERIEGIARGTSGSHYVEHRLEVATGLVPVLQAQALIAGRLEILMVSAVGFSEGSRTSQASL